MEIISSFIVDFTSVSFLLALVLTCLCCMFALFTVRSSSPVRNSRQVQLDNSGGGDTTSRTKTCHCVCSCNGSVGKSQPEESLTSSIEQPHLNGGVGDMQERAPVVSERVWQTGASMMEQLVPEITTHALSYLDYPSLCRLSMTNSLMRKAANDDSAWKALYHKDFTLEQDNITPVNGWKAYYAATRAIVNVNAEFFDIIRERSLPAMRRLWLNADYVKCVHASGELFSGYNAVIQSWQLGFNWEQGFDFQIRDIRARVLTDMAWVTMKTYVDNLDMNIGPFNVTNVFEFQNGQWYMVHHHISVFIDGEVEQ